MGEGFVRTRGPADLIEEMHGKDIARVYLPLDLSLDTARDDALFTFRGNSLTLIHNSDVTVPVYVRLNARDNPRIPLFGAGSLTRAFDRIFVTHAAAAGGRAVFLLDWDLRT